MKKNQKSDNDSYYGISAFIAVFLTILIHGIFLSKLTINSTLHVTIGLFIFFILCAAISSILSKFW